MIIKVCGLTDNTESHAVTELDAVDMLGFIFYEGSSRYTESTLATTKKKVGVFVNAPLDYVIEKVQTHGLKAVQLHGSEPPEYIRQLPKGIEIIKVFGIATAEDLEQTKAYEGLAGMFLFDTKSPKHGGTGTAFDWQVLENYKGETPFLLSGGIGRDSAEALKKFSHPKLAGYDLNSRFELAPKIKDATLIAKFLNEMKP
nr:phosphoribosylanthranilate isomerase [uncultured Flavobacterium sp.]